MSEISEILDGAGVFDASPEMERIRDFARARRVSPWAMLGATLTRLCASIPPTVVLPPLVGSHGSLNLFVGIVGTSGIGKGAAERASRDGVDLGAAEPFTSSVGSGEGLLHLFARYDKEIDDVVMHRTEALLSVPEVDALTALGGRQGATLLPTLRSVFSGEQLSPAYANREKALRLDSHTYRVAMIVGIQPGRAGSLLDDSDGGTPQRFIWLPGTDPGAPDEPPPAPEPLLIRPQDWPGARVVLTVDARAEQTIVDDRAEVLRGNRPSSHLLFVRLKLAALLAILQGRRAAVTRDDWEVAGRIIRVSEHTRRDVATYLKSASTTAIRERGRLDGERRDAAEQSAADAAMRRVCQWITGRLERHPDGMTPGALRKAAASRDRDLIDAALAALAEVGNVICDGDPDRGTYRTGGRHA